MGSNGNNRKKDIAKFLDFATPFFYLLRDKKDRYLQLRLLKNTDLCKVYWFICRNMPPDKAL